MEVHIRIRRTKFESGSGKIKRIHIPDQLHSQNICPTENGQHPPVVLKGQSNGIFDLLFFFFTQASLGH